MRITCVGGGPAGLYFALLMKRDDRANDVLVLERNRADDTFGFGVVFSDRTLEGLAAADAASHDEIVASFARWDEIEIHWKGTVIRSTGHGFAGFSRQRLLDILQRRCRDAGVDLRFQTDVVSEDAWRGSDLVLLADGVNSRFREKFASSFGPAVDLRPNRFVWLGTTLPFEAFTFWFKRNEHGLFRVHAYRYEPGRSTFIVECTGETFDRTGLAPEDEEGAIAYVERLFAAELQGHRLQKNRSVWRNFPTVRNRSWRHGNAVLVGDAAHTAHFSIGSGTKLALEDAIALRDAVRAHRGDVPAALEAYEAARRPAVESLQRAAQSSLEWFEHTERYEDLPPETFAMSLLTRSLRVSHESLRLRDPAFVSRVERSFAAAAFRAAGESAPPDPVPPPIFTPFRVRSVTLPNRIVVSPMCMYSADDGVPNDWHLVHLGSRALGGAGLVIAEATGVSPEGRITPGCTGIWNDAQAAAWRRITDFVHTHSPARIGLQIAHAGRKAATHVPWKGKGPLGDPAWTLLAPSAVAWDAGYPVPREMDAGDIDRVTGQFGDAARRAVAAGFDWLEIHMAHGYLLSEFLSPLTNRRTDAYGGTPENRLRLPLEVVTAVRTAWGEDRPLSIRISATDWAEAGNSGADAVAIAGRLREAGGDLVDVSSGGVVPQQSPVHGRLWQTPFAERIRLEAGVPTMAVGAVFTHGDANAILASGRADLCVLARAHLQDPNWTLHAATELGVPTRWPDPYRSVEKLPIRRS